jgi:SAM-dependent methyltransferase
MCYENQVRCRSQEFAGDNFDLICCFDALHDLGDPVGAARRILQALAPDGTFMAVEPRAGDRLEDNINPVGRLYYAGSTMICTPVSLAQEVGLALGGQAGPKRLEAVLREAGFGRVRIAADARSSYSKRGDEFKRCCYFLSHEQPLLTFGKDIFS